MVVKVLNRNISIVVVASNIDKKTCSPFWLHKNGLISNEEMQSIKEDGVNIDGNVVSFSTSTFDFLCDPFRLQIQSSDITQSSRLVSLVRDVLRCAQPRINAIGINAMMQFSFSNSLEFLKFCHHCAPLDGLSPLSDNAILLDLTLMDWSKEQKAGDLQTIYNIKRLSDSPEKTQMAQISVNNHQPIDGNMITLNSILRMAEELHFGFFERSDSFIKGIN